MRDLKMTDDGELVVAANGDFDTVSNDDRTAQAVLFRLKTTPGDWTLFPEIGTNLEQFIGAPNVPTTHRAIEAEVRRSLAVDGFLTTARVDVVALNLNEVLVAVEFPSVEIPRRVVQIVSTMDLREGLVFSRRGFRST